MKRVLPLLFLLLAYGVSAQVTTPVIKAGMGIDGDLRANFFKGANLSGNDDWFTNSNTGTGTYLIDTTGASAVVRRYNLNILWRKSPISRGMRLPPFSVVNNRLLIDALFIRDYHGDDSTVFAGGANKNCMSPQEWSTPVSQGIPDKNDILDSYLHIRRDGATLQDSLWLMGGISIDNTNGNRYFDFEFYQTEITYDRPNLRFLGYGSDAGHTSWLFDSLGNVIRPGDIILTASYPSSSLNEIEARIWIDSLSMMITPMAFRWGGKFDGATNGSKFGYANILPKTPGDFFAGLESDLNAWPGPFNLILQDESMVTTYEKGQFMEFSVNLSKLGLDPLLYAADPCKMPFSKVLIKSRSSTSFTSQLKDFVGPFNFYRPSIVVAAADLPILCGSSGVSTISVQSPLPSSIYSWTTPDGNIISGTTGPSIVVDKAGIYIVNQQLMTGCGNSYSSDTVIIVADPVCMVLKSNLKSFQVSLWEAKSTLQWTISQNLQLRSFTIERSTDNRNFLPVGEREALPVEGEVPYLYQEDLSGINEPLVFYRIRVNDISGRPTYSKIIALTLQDNREVGITLFPNPVKSDALLSIRTYPSFPGIAEVSITDNAGTLMRKFSVAVMGKTMNVSMGSLDLLPVGTYLVTVKVGQQQYVKRMIRAY